MTDFAKIDRYKAVIDALRPFEGDTLNEIKAYYKIACTWTSNALEGNTLTEIETKILLEDELTAGGKPLRYTFEAIGHAKAYEFMFTLLHNHQITESDVLTMHKMFYYDISADDAGRYRTRPVIITGSQYPVCEPEKIQTEMRSLFEWANNERQKYHPVEFAALLSQAFRFHPSVYRR